MFLVLDKKISLCFWVKCVYVSWIVPKHNSNTRTVESDRKRLKVAFRQEFCSTEEVSGCCTKKSKSALKYGRQLWIMVWPLGLHPNTILARVRLKATGRDSKWLFDRSPAPQRKCLGVTFFWTAKLKTGPKYSRQYGGPKLFLYLLNQNQIRRW